MKNIKIYKSQILLLAIVFFSLSAKAQNFSTKTNNIRNSVVAEINHKPVLFLSSLSSSLAAYTLKGEELWRFKIDNPSVIFEILAEDINNDGNDDVLAVAGNGIVYCINSDGKLLWKYSPEQKTRLSEIAVVKNNDKIQIFAGGNNYQLYELNTQGKLVSKTKIKGVVRKIESGKFLDSSKETLFLMTYVHDKFRWEFMGFLNPETKAVIKQVSYKKNDLKSLSKIMVTDIEIADINKDHKDDILFFGDTKFRPFFTTLDANFNVIAEYEGNRKQIQRYAHSQGAFLPKRNEIMFQHGGILIVLDHKGKLKNTGGERYGKGVYSNFVYESKTNQLILQQRLAGTVTRTNGTLYNDSDVLKGLQYIPTTTEGSTETTISLGRQNVIYAHNQTGGVISRGDLVFINGTAHGTHPRVALAQANSAKENVIHVYEDLTKKLINDADFRQVMYNDMLDFASKIEEIISENVITLSQEELDAMSDDEKRDIVTHNVAFLETLVNNDVWTTEDMTAVNNAITNGNAY